MYTKQLKNSFEELLERQKSEIIEIIKYYFEESQKRQEKKWIKSSQVCELLSCSQATLFRLRNDRILPCSIVQGTYYYKISDVDQMMENGKLY